jgi:hypothetical protein
VLHFTIEDSFLITASVFLLVLMKMVCIPSLSIVLYSFVISPIQGVGAVYGYDAVGSFKRDDYGAMGSGQNFIMPILDNLV